MNISSLGKTEEILFFLPKNNHLDFTLYDFESLNSFKLYKNIYLLLTNFLIKEKIVNLFIFNKCFTLSRPFPVGKITEKAVCRSVFF